MFRSSIIYGIAAISSQVFVLLLLPLLSRTLSVPDFAMVSLLEAYLALFSALGSLSLERAVQRFYFDSGIDKDELLGITVRVITTASMAIVIFTGVLAVYYEFARNYIYYFFISLCGFGLSLSGLFLVYAQVTDKPLLHVFNNLLKGFIFFILCSYFIGVLRLGVDGYVVALVSVYFGLACLAAFYLPRPKLTKASYSLIVKMLHYSLPFLPSAFAAWGITMGGRFILEQGNSLHQVGLYSFWFKVSLVYFVATGSINMALTPIVFNSYGKSGMSSSLRNMFHWVYQIYFFGAVALLLISKELGALLGGDNYDHSYFLFSLIICTHFLSSSIGATSDLLFYSQKKTFQHMLIFVTGCLLTLFIGIIFAPRYGAEGVAAGALVGLLFISTVHGWYQRIKDCNFDFYILIGLAIVLLFCGSVCAVFNATHFDYLLRWLVAIILVVIAFNRFKAVSRQYGYTVDC